MREGKIVLNGTHWYRNSNCIRVEADVEGANSIWFEVADEYENYIDTQSVDAFAVLYTWIAMETCKDLEINGTVSKKLSESIFNEIKSIFHNLCPSLNNNISICFNKIKSSYTSEFKRVKATGFSGGVDSLYTIYKNNNYDTLLFTNTGQHGRSKTEDVFNSRFNLAKECLNDDLIPFIKVNTNMDDVFNNNFIQTHTLRNSSCALFLQNGICHFGYSAGLVDTCNKEDIKPSDYMASIDGVILPLFSTERLTFCGEGGNKDRNDKITSIVTDLKFSGKIYVCTNKLIPAKNCGHCFKCRRTMVALNELGFNEVLDSNFDLFYKRKLAMKLALLVNARKKVTDKETANLVYKNMGISRYPFIVLVYILALLKSITPEFISWRVRSKYPYLW